jgi:transmembrane sensor
MTETDTSCLAQAAAWRVRLAENDLVDCPELSAWLAEDPRHAQAWKLIQNDWALFGEYASSPELLELRSQALAHAHEAGRGRWTRSRKLAGTRKLSLAAAVALLAIGGALFWMKQPEVYVTRAGERRVVTLSDRSQVALDSSSEVRVQYSTHARELTLVRGQARFDVAHDVARPFSVTADSHEVIATGTSFNVDLFGPSLLVTLIEGRVVVSSTTPQLELAKFDQSRVDTPVPRITLDVGEQVVFTPKAPPSVAHVNIGQATAWENGEVVSDNDTLATIVGRMNRYAQHALIIGDEETAELRISGVFHTDDVEGFVSTIEAYLPVAAEKDSDGTTRLAHR